MGQATKITNKELLDISVKIEREAQVFYKELAGHISDMMVKNYLLLMAKDEAHHEKQFETILGEKGDQKYGWEDSAGLHELIDKRLKPGLFPKLEDLFGDLPGFEDIRKALNVALKCEELAVEFYGILRKCCEDPETEILLITMESEERSHRDYIRTLIQYWKRESS